MFLINWKTKFKVLYLDFVFTSIWKAKFKQLISIFIFARFLLRVFNALIRFSFSSKKEKLNTVYFLFSWRNWKKSYLKRSRLTLWLFSQVWSTRYPSASSCQVLLGFPLCNGHSDIKNSLFRKQLMYFNVYIAGCYFHICFILTVNCDIKHTSRSRHRQVFS